MTATMRATTTKQPRKPARKRVGSAKPKALARTPDHAEICERAYFIHLEDGGSDELGNWLRAERELMTV